MSVCIFGCVCVGEGGTMDEFIAKAEAVFSIAIVTDYDAEV